VFEKMKEKSMPSKPATPPIGTPTPTGPSDADKKSADALKAQGNAAMAKKDFTTAVERYTQALELTPKNPIFLSNRAAAYSSLGQHEKAIEDAQVAVDTDPAYTKAWSRLGLARFAVGDARGSMEAYKAGIEAEGNGGSEIMKNGYQTAKKRVEEEDAESAGSSDAARSSSPPSGAAQGGMPDLASLASMFGGRGGGGNGGGMPDFGSIMNNPMFAQMAQKFMSNPSLMQNMMSNPRVREMMDSLGGGGDGNGEGGRGGGMPDLGSLMSDPSIAELSVPPHPLPQYIKPPPARS
jgi:small glutamine-rich tetratricopeptide repeat-containing protein alpha